MNIFALNDDPELAAQQHCDKHVVKMIVEYTQLLSTAHRVLDGEQATVGKRKFYLLLGEELLILDRPVIHRAVCYNATHAAHPCAIWVRRSIGNYQWLLSLLEHLCLEYTRRYGRVHASTAYLPFLRTEPRNIPYHVRSPFVQCMPDQYQVPNDPIAGYQAFYLGEKIRFAKYSNRSLPTWFEAGITSKGLHASDFTRTRPLHPSTVEGD
jgi:hypothetical protein